MDKATRRTANGGLLIVIVAIVALEATSLLQYNFTHRVLEGEANRRAEGQLKATELQILNVMDQVETAVRNSVWSVEQQLGKPDSLLAITTRLVAANPVICGSTVALKDKNLAPYSYQEGNVILTSSLATEEYDYKNQEWFLSPIGLGSGYWSEPYFDEGGGNMLMTTYSVPVKDKRGNVAVFTADVSLDWLAEMMDNVKVYPSSFSMLVSREGRIMACPAETLVMNHTIEDLAHLTGDAESFEGINRALLSGESGRASVNLEGKSQYLFFDSVDRAGWAMSIVIPEDEVYGEVNRIGRMVLVMQLLSIALLIIILFFMIRNQRKMQAIEQNKSRMEGELQVARGIQMSMIPKIFPPYPERGDVDMYAAVVPAKEVGGDLYDFYIREEKLFFCIGDVSGKGVPASLVMAVTRSLFRTVSAHEKSPQRIVTSINNSMADMNETNMFVTMFCGVLDLKTGHLRYCNAGHNAPILVGKGDNAELHVVPNLPLGVLAEMSFTEQEADLECGTGLFMYTDGLTEAESATHELFGEERMLKALDAKLSSEQQIQAMTGAVKAFVKEADQSDDLTMLYIRFMNNHVSEETERHLILHNDIQQIPQLAEFVEAVADVAKLDVALTMSINLALEEAVSNVIMYAYPTGSDGLVDIEAIIRKDSLQFIVSDNGKPFDPTAAPEADISLDVADRPIGGLGIFLVRNIMDEVTYTRSDDGKNILTMTKKLA